MISSVVNMSVQRWKKWRIAVQIMCKPWTAAFAQDLFTFSNFALLSVEHWRTYKQHEAELT